LVSFAVCPTSSQADFRLLAKSVPNCLVVVGCLETVCVCNCEFACAVYEAWIGSQNQGGGERESE